MSRRRLRPRIAAPIVLAAVLVSFSFPFLTVTADQRRADATGLELVANDVEYGGRYVHDAWRGEVENVVEDGQLWAVPASVAFLVALVLVLLPWRAAWWGGLGVSAIATVLLLLWLQATTTAYHPPNTDHRWGYWLTLLLAPLAIVPILSRLFEPVGDPNQRRPPEWLLRSTRRRG